jgi:hypothetical protein
MGLYSVAVHSYRFKNTGGAVWSRDTLTHKTSYRCYTGHTDHTDEPHIPPTHTQDPATIIERPAPRMRRHSPRAGCGGCAVGGKPGNCLEDGVSTIRGLCACATHLLLVVGQRRALAGGWTGTSAVPAPTRSPQAPNAGPVEQRTDAQKACESFGLMVRPVGRSRACGNRKPRLTAVSHRAGMHMHACVCIFPIGLGSPPLYGINEDGRAYGMALEGTARLTYLDFCFLRVSR